MEISEVQAIKLFLLQLTGLSRDALHVYAGMIVFLLSAALFKKKLLSHVPWLVVVAVACCMEALDARDDMHLFGHWRVGESIHDIINTIIWPTVIFLICRFTALARKG